jgi:hypothetical protein
VKRLAACSLTLGASKYKMTALADPEYDCFISFSDSPGRRADLFLSEG